MALICCEHNVNCDPGPDSAHHSSLPCVSSIVLFIWCLKITLWIKTGTIIWALNNILSLARTKARTSGLLNHLVFWDLRTTRAGQCAQDNNEDHLNTCLMSASGGCWDTIDGLETQSETFIYLNRNNCFLCDFNFPTLLCDFNFPTLLFDQSWVF